MSGADGHPDPSATRTYLFQLDLEGAPLDAGREIAIPWPIAAVAWNGHGYHLAVLYPGSGSGMRLSMVSLGEGHQPTAGYVEQLRQRLAQRFPGLVFYFQSPDIASQVLNFGLSAPIDIQIAGPQGNAAENERIARLVLPTGFAAGIRCFKIKLAADGSLHFASSTLFAIWYSSCAFGSAWSRKSLRC